MVLTTAVVLGASGNVGREIVRCLLKSPHVTRILLVGRRNLADFDDPRISQEIVEMTPEAMESLAPKLAGIDAAFCALGIGKSSQATAEELERVDVTLPSAFARSLKAANVHHVALLTAVGADITAKPSAITKTAAGGGLYNHLKGKVEQNFQSLGFPSLAIIRPSTILGNENTPGAWGWIAPKIDCVLPSRFKSIQVVDLGRAFVITAERSLDGMNTGLAIFEGASLFEIAAPTSTAEK